LSVSLCFRFTLNVFNIFICPLLYMLFWFSFYRLELWNSATLLRESCLIVSASAIWLSGGYWNKLVVVRVKSVLTLPDLKTRAFPVNVRYRRVSPSCKARRWCEVIIQKRSNSIESLVSFDISEMSLAETWGCLWTPLIINNWSPWSSWVLMVQILLSLWLLNKT
jgi:hypothetical protein